KIQAFYHYVDKFLNSVENLDKKINSFSVGISLKEDLENKKPSFKQTVTDIKVELKNIKSKKLYMKFFFLPTYNNSRKKIVDSLKGLQIINKQIEEFQSDEEEQEENIKYLKKLAAKKDIQNKSPLQKEIKNKIQNILEKNLFPIAQDLKKITASTSVKARIEKKRKKKEEQERQSAQKARQSRGRRRSYQPSSSSYGESPWSDSSRSSEYGSRDSWSPSSRKGYSTRDSRPSRFSKAPQDSYKQLSSTDKSSKDDKNKDSIITTGKTPKEYKKVLSLTNTAVKILEKIKKLYKQDDQSSYDQTINSKLLSKLEKNLTQINENKDQLSETQKTNLEKNKNYKGTTLQNLLSQFVPAGVRLAKYPSNAIEQESTIKILTYAPTEKVPTETKKYEQTIIDALKNKHDEIRQYFGPTKNIETISKNLKILLSKPQSNPVKIDKIKNDFSISYQLVKNNWSKFSQTYENLMEIKERILNNTANSINTVNGLNTEIDNIANLPQKAVLKQKAIANANPPINNTENFNQNAGNKIRSNIEKIIKNLMNREVIISEIGNILKK
ncbi:hypothetical protein ACFLYH_01445, partial [Candidatus Dependentiae bacterium]